MPLRRAIKKQTETEQILRARTQELTISNEELQAFAYSVSHDLQEPLRMISLYVQLIERRFPPDSAEGKSILNTIGRQALRMQDMVLQLLQLSRVARSQVEKTSVSLREIVDTVLDDLEVPIRSTSAEVLIAQLPSVPGWPDRLNVVFQNLISNALKYRKDNVAPRIEIRALARLYPFKQQSIGHLKGAREGRGRFFCVECGDGR
jgi:two-component system sensor kinase FixL